jgi:hypothetical protein
MVAQSVLSDPALPRIGLFERGAAVIRRVLILGWVATLAIAGVLQAQVGLSSGLAQVVLVARSAPRGSIDSIGLPVERANGGSTREVSVAVMVSSNTAYRLSVIRNDDRNSKWGDMWVRAAGGEFQSLERGSVILVARGQSDPAIGSLNVFYRLERGAPTGAIQAPPVRYELAITPQL